MKDRTIAITSYDKLVDLAIKLTEFNIEYFGLFELIDFQRASKDVLENFESLILKLSEGSEVVRTLWIFMKSAILEHDSSNQTIRTRDPFSPKSTITFRTCDAHKSKIGIKVIGSNPFAKHLTPALNDNKGNK